MNYISDVLFWISTGMLVPVIILLIFFFLRALLLLGGFFGQYLVKRKSGAEIREQMNTLTLDNIDTLGDRLPRYCQKKPPRSSKALRKKKIKKIITGTSMPVEIQNNTSDM